MIDIKESLVAAMDAITLRCELRNPSGEFLATGYYVLDDMIGLGIRPGNLVVIGGRPSMGKSALALNIAEHAACELKRTVLVIAPGSDDLSINERLLSGRALVDGHKLKTGRGFGSQDMVQLGSAYTELYHARIFTDCSSRPTVDAIGDAASLIIKGGQELLDLIVIDPLDLVEPDNRVSVRHEQVGQVIRDLKRLAHDLSVVLVVCSEINKPDRDRFDHRPVMADLRESSSIEEQADLVLLLHRPDYYHADDQPGLAELIIAKNRPGATGTVKLAWLNKFSRFENLALVADPLGGSF